MVREKMTNKAIHLHTGTDYQSSVCLHSNSHVPHIFTVIILPCALLNVTRVFILCPVLHYSNGIDELVFTVYIALGKKYVHSIPQFFPQFWRGEFFGCLVFHLYYV